MLSSSCSLNTTDRAKGDELESQVRRKLGPEHRTSSAWQITLQLFNENNQLRDQIKLLEQRLQQQQEAETASQKKLKELADKLKVQRKLLEPLLDETNRAIAEITEEYGEIDLQSDTDESLTQSSSGGRIRPSSFFKIFSPKKSDSNPSSPASSPRNSATPPQSPKHQQTKTYPMKKSSTTEGLPRRHKT